VNPQDAFQSWGLFAYFRKMNRFTVKAPGRICLFGDHQDYLQLPIIACAINRYITITGIPNSYKYFTVVTPDLDQERILSFHHTNSSSLNGDHLAAALKVVAQHGCVPTQGYTVTISGNVPINAGLSSSSALVVAWVKWLLVTFGCNSELTPLLVAQLAYQAEVVEQKSPGGKMDQYTSALGDILYLETDAQSSFKLLNNSLNGLIVGVSGIPKDTIGLLGDLRGNALNSIAIVKKEIQHFELSKATLVDYEKYKNLLPAELSPYFYGAIQNHLITQRALREFNKPDIDYGTLGSLMNDHHTVLKDILKITVPRIDAMITAAIEAGAYGAKIVGSGGGGSICALASKKTENDVISAIRKAGALDAYGVQVSKGVRLL